MKRPIRILYIDDNALDRELVRDALQQKSGTFTLIDVSTSKELNSALLKNDFDLILSDFNILGFEGLQVIDLVHKKDPNLPVIIVTGTGSEQVAVEAMKRGAEEYVIKTPQHIRRLPQTIMSVLEKKKLERERFQVEEALRENQSLLRAIVDSTPDAIFAKDLMGRYILYNAGAAAIFGKKGEDVLGHDDHVIFPKAADEMIAKDRMIIDGGKTVTYEETVIVSSKQFKTFLTTKGPLYGKNKELIGLFGIAHDITLRKQTEEHLKSILENIRDVIFTLSPSGIVVSFNHAFEEITGWKTDDWIGKSFTDLVHPADLKNVQQIIRQVFTGSNPPLVEIHIRKQDGAYVLGEFHVSTQRQNNKVVGVLGIARDITERKKSEETKKILEEQLQHSMKLESLGTLASGIAHDFNNILGIIIANASIVERLPLDRSTIQKNIDAIIKASMRGAGLVKQMLTFARKTDVIIISTNLNESVNEVVKLLHETFPKKITVSLELEDNLPRIEADSTQLHQVILNLCVNARDAMPNGGTLTISTEILSGKALRAKYPKAAASEYISLTVQDTGTGMDEETRMRIFEPFFTTKEIGKGTGLGLSLIFGIIENHQGFISVQSEIGKGTTFHCYFPVHHTIKENIFVEKQTTAESPGGNETILVVEDEDLLRKVVQIFLESKGYTVIPAGDGEEGLQLYRQNQKTIALVLSDLGLPKLGGDELHIKLTEVDPHVRMIIASGYVEPGMKAKFIEAGVIEFIQKPYDPNEVLQAIRRVLDKK